MALHSFDQDYVAANVLHDDTEEDLVGSDLHQLAIRALYEGLWLAGPRRGLPWHVSTQLYTMMGQVRGKSWNPSPDILVHPSVDPAPLSSFDVKVHGVPPFVAEVASPSTWVYDVDAKRKAYGYAGVQEYLVFDPTGDLLGVPVLAWHRTPEGFESWPAGADGRWHSEVLPVSLWPEGLLLRVLDQAGVLLPTFDEQLHRADEQARRVAELEAELARLRGQDT